MNPPSEPCVHRLIDAHFAGTIAPPDEGALRAHLYSCPSCRGYYRRHLLFSRFDPRAKSAKARIARGLGLRLKRKDGAVWTWAVAFSAAVVLAVVVPLTRRAPSEFSARGGNERGEPAFFAYRMNPSVELAPGSTIHASDDLAFAYANPSGFRRLLVYGVDEHKHVYWYYPAWSNPGDDPHAVAVASDPQVRELPEAIRHDLDGRELTLHAVFLDGDTGVRDVESAVAEGRAAVESFAVGRSYEKQLTLKVER
jgi:hypothetical protein